MQKKEGNSVLILALLIIFVNVGIFLFMHEKDISGNVIEQGYKCGSYSLTSINSDGVSASSILSSNFAAGKASDGNSGSYWLSSLGSGPHWLQIDLGSKQCISALEVYFSTNYVSLTMDILISQDGNSWSNVVSGWNVQQGEIFVRKDFLESSARYVRIYQTAGKGVQGSGGSGSVVGSGSTTSSGGFYGSVSEIKVNKADLVAVQEDQQLQNNQQVQQCIDNDGKNYSVKGSVMITNSNLSDFCASASQVSEYLCSGAEYLLENYTCSNGCLNGKCSLQQQNQQDTEEEKITLLARSLLDEKIASLSLGDSLIIKDDLGDYTFNLLQINAQEATFRFAEKKEAFVLDKGESVGIDVGDDGQADFEVKFLLYNEESKFAVFSLVLASQYSSEDYDYSYGDEVSNYEEIDSGNEIYNSGEELSGSGEELSSSENTDEEISQQSDVSSSNARGFVFIKKSDTNVGEQQDEKVTIESKKKNPSKQFLEEVFLDGKNLAIIIFVIFALFVIVLILFWMAKGN